MAKQVYQVVGKVSKHPAAHSWVVATYDDHAEADQHTDFLNDLLAGLKAIDAERGNNVFLSRLQENHPYDSNYPRNAGEDVLYVTQSIQVLSRAPVAPAGVPYAVTKLESPQA